MTLIKPNSLFREWSGKLTADVRIASSPFPIGKVPNKQVPDRLINSVCGYCATGCSLRIHMRQDQPVNLNPDSSYPVNQGMACPKGWEALAPLSAPDRATFPVLKNPTTGKQERVTWDGALKAFCDNFRRIQEQHGPEAVAFLSTGQIVSEEMAMLGALAKFGMGMVHGDGNTRQCMATAVTAYKESFGFDAPPYTYRDFEESDVLVFVGSNPCIAHPIMWQRVQQNRRNPKIVVIDPRVTETAMAATHHFALTPKSDLPLLYAVAHILDREGWLDAGFIEQSTSNYSSFRSFLKDYSPKKVAAVCGLSVAEIEVLAELVRPGKRVSFWWTMGVNQSHEGTRTAQAIINLALMTGNIGKPGTGANSITGQCNAMGSRLFSNTTSLLGGHAFTCQGDREKVAGILGMDPAKIPDRNSWDYARIIEGIDHGDIKGLWIVATNPSHSWIHQNRFNEILDKLDFLVVQDMYNSTETAVRADLVLPAAGWGEKEGTFINSERRIGRVCKVARAPGEALSDFYIFKLIAEYWGCGDLFRRWDEPEDVFNDLVRLTKDQPCDISGISGYALLEESGGIQWPCQESGQAVVSERRLFADGRFFTEDARARFCFEPSREAPESVCQEYPFILLTGRGSSAQWHTQTRTGKSAVLRKLYPAQCYLEINPKDASQLGIQSHDRVRISSRRGNLTAIAFITNSVKPGRVFVPMHYARTNQLTFPVVDPYSRQPSYKHCAVSVGLTS